MLINDAIAFINTAFELVVLIEAIALYLLYKRISMLESNSRSFTTHEQVDKRINEKLELVLQKLDYIKEKIDDRK
jgi:hypothetical protein